MAGKVFRLQDEDYSGRKKPTLLLKYSFQKQVLFLNKIMLRGQEYDEKILLIFSFLTNSTTVFFRKYGIYLQRCNSLGPTCVKIVARVQYVLLWLAK